MVKTSRRHITQQIVCIVTATMQSAHSIQQQRQQQTTQIY